MSCGGGRDGGGPPPVSNPPGLSQIAYRAGDFTAFRHALLTPLAGEQQLTGWSPRPGDLGLQVLEWWAYLADILTFYNERIANGSYLGTAVAQPGPQLAAALAALLGYRSTPAITATGLIAAIRSAGAPDGPLAIPAGPQMQVMSTPTADVPAQLFEVTDARTFTGRSDAVISLPPDPALFRPVGGQAPTTGAASQTVLLAGPVTVSPGDELIIVSRAWDGTTADWSVVSADSAVTEKDPGGRANTRLALSSADWHGLADGPGTVPLASDYQLQRALSTAALWTMSAGVGSLQTAGTPPSPGAGPSSQALTVPLATVVRTLRPGDNVLFSGSAGGAAPRAVRLLAQVTSYTEEVARVPAPAGGTTTRAGSQPDLYISHTNLVVRTAGADADVAALRSALGTSGLGGIVMRYGFRDAGQLIPAPATSLDRLPVTVGVPADLRLPGGPAALQDANGTGVLVTASAAGPPGSVTLAPWDGAPGVLDPALQAPVTLLADLVPVSRGSTVSSEVLGDGDPSAVGQAFVLRCSPLVYLPPAEPGGDPVSTLAVTVNGAPWREVPAFSSQPPAAPVYVTCELPSGSVQVTFGDGVNGARLPLGTGNVTATYRYGAPAPPPPAGALATVLTPQPNLGAVRNPVGIAGGTMPESPGTTAQAAPATVVLLPGMNSVTAPLISLADSERIAATVSGVTRARAYWTWDAGLRCPAVTVYVGCGGDPATAVTAVSGLFPRDSARVPLNVAPARDVRLLVIGRLLCPAGAGQDVIRAATMALTGPAGLFSPRRMRIGQRLYRSEVEAALMVPGVSAVLGLRVRRPGPGKPPDGHGEARDEPVLDPGQGGYFSLLAGDLAISAVTR